MKTNFYDIESVKNAFILSNWKPDENEVDTYYLVDNPELMQAPGFYDRLITAVRKANLNFKGKVILHDLKTEYANRHLFKTFGLSDAYMVSDKNSRSTFPAEFRIVCDTDPEYDENKHPYLMGYNSENYDDVMLACYACEAYLSDTANNSRRVFGASLNPVYAVTAAKMREHNDAIFTNFRERMTNYLRSQWDEQTKSYINTGYDDPRYKIHRNFKYTGRHIDVSKLNEKQRKVGLKRIIGQLGGQILESEKLGKDNFLHSEEELIDLIAYNISDVVNLDLVVFRHKLYSSQMVIKRNLLTRYPELIYEKKKNEYAPDMVHVRRDRLYPDSSSAKLATTALCPYGHLSDIEGVSYLYPAKEKAEALGIPQVNVLEEARKFFYGKFPQPELRAQFDRIYKYYKDIEGKNFNDGQQYMQDFPHTQSSTTLSDLPKTDLTLYYYNKDGTPTTCYVNFSVGGIHGAEYNRDLYLEHFNTWRKQKELFDKVKAIYPDPCDLRKAKKVEIDGKTYSWGQFLKSNATLTCSYYKDIDAKMPRLFVEKNGQIVLANKYTFASAERAEHEDFVSYYPNLLIMLMAFHNPGLGYDRYAEIFQNKQDYGFLMKESHAKLSPEDSTKYKKIREETCRPIGITIDPFLVSKDERECYSDTREGTKLVLNSASGAADANYDNIKLSNRIISMRIIGQLFTWRIGQAQAYEGAKIISTNTDGLYSVMRLPGKTIEESEAYNNEILARESANIGVEIEPETMVLISKDTNNRMEMDENACNVDKANGGSLACYKGPVPTKSLAHPAILDWALTEYMAYAVPENTPVNMHDPFNKNVGRNILKAAPKTFKGWKLLQMYQNVIANSVGSVTYNFYTTDADPSTPVPMQHYNRVFIVKDAGPDTVHIRAAAGRVITAAVRAKRHKDGIAPKINDPVASVVLLANDVDPVKDLGATREAVVKKISGISEDWNMIIVNEDLMLMSEEKIQSILDRLDYEKYLESLHGTFERSWRNHLPGYLTDDVEDGDDDTAGPKINYASGIDEIVSDDDAPEKKAGKKTAKRMQTTKSEVQEPAEPKPPENDPVLDASVDDLLASMAELSRNLAALQNYAGMSPIKLSDEQKQRLCTAMKAAQDASVWLS